MSGACRLSDISRNAASFQEAVRDKWLLSKRGLFVSDEVSSAVTLQLQFLEFAPLQVVTLNFASVPDSDP
jgi:hypothetical protein